MKFQNTEPPFYILAAPSDGVPSEHERPTKPTPVSTAAHSDQDVHRPLSESLDTVKYIHVQKNPASDRAASMLILPQDYKTFFHAELG